MDLVAESYRSAAQLPALSGVELKRNYVAPRSRFR